MGKGGEGGLEMAGHTGEAIVVLVGEVVVDKDRVRIALLLEPVLHVVDLCLWDLQTGPAVPLICHCLGQTAEACYQATGGHGEVVLAIVGALDGEGQAVGDDEQAAAIVRVGLFCGHVGSWMCKVDGQGQQEEWEQEEGESSRSEVCYAALVDLKQA